MRRWVPLLVVLGLVGLVLVWAYTEEEPAVGTGYYGSLINLKDQGAADLFQVKKTGQYVVNKEGKLVHPLRGGIRMIFRGLAQGDGSQVNVGFRGVRVGFIRTPEGIGGLVFFGLLALFGIVTAVRRRRGQAGATP
jgi:hypothetical protein